MSLDMHKHRDTILRWCCGNESAADMLMIFSRAIRLADDIVDEAGPHQERVIELLHLTTISLPGNHFYQQHRVAMATVAMEMLVHWKLGDDWRDADTVKKQMFGYVTRETTDRLPLVVASICGGTLHAAEVANEVYDLVHASDPETFEDWRLEGRTVVPLKKKDAK